MFAFEYYGKDMPEDEYHVIDIAWLSRSSNLLFAGPIPSSSSFLNLTTAMENSEGRLVDLYIPRKWYASSSSF
jgi:hypothetical protein